MNQVIAFHTSCSACPIRHKAVCANCEGEELETLNRIKFYKTYAAGQTIAIRGDALDVVASLVSGTAVLERGIEDGRTQMVGLLLPSDFIGRPGRDDLPYDVTAISEVTLCCFQRAPFEKMLRATPNLSERMLEMALDELDAAREWMLLLGRKTAREKIASLLVLLYRRAALPGWQVPGLPQETRIDLPLSRDAIGNYLGLTIETVSRQLSALKREGVIRLDGTRGVIIPDLSALIAETGDTDDS